jgi:hypothetical protein
LFGIQPTESEQAAPVCFPANQLRPNLPMPWKPAMPKQSHSEQQCLMETNFQLYKSYKVCTTIPLKKKLFYIKDYEIRKILSYEIYIYSHHFKPQCSTVLPALR